MNDQFTDRARKVMQLANQEAMRLCHEYIGTEHILLGIVKESSGVAVNVLRLLQVDCDRVRREIEKIVQPGSTESHWAKFRGASGRLPSTPRAAKILEYAIDESRNLGHKYVGTEHLLLGLLREEEGVAAQVLKDFGVTLAICRQEVQRILGYPVDETKPGTPPPTLEDSGETLDNLPDGALEVLKMFDRQLDMMQEAKEDLVAAQKWEPAAALRDIELALRKLRADFIRLWPKD